MTVTKMRILGGVGGEKHQLWEGRLYSSPPRVGEEISVDGERVYRVWRIVHRLHAAGTRDADWIELFVR